MTPLLIDRSARVAILAGGGDLPLMIADSVRARGGAVHIVAIAGEADRRVEAYPHTWVNFAAARAMFAALRGAGQPARNVMVIAGAVKRPDLSSLRPDLGFPAVVVELLALISAGGDDALLTKGIRMFERRGLTVVGVQDVAPELLLGAGLLGRHSVDAAAEFDLERAHEVLAALGDLDVGQGVVVEAGRVLAIEGVEGTDAMLARVAASGQARRAVLLKAPKPRQERRVDLPTVGLQTVTRAAAAGVRGIGVIAGESIGLQREAMRASADRLGVFVAGLAPRPARPPAAAVQFQVDVLSLRDPRLADMADATRGGEAVLRLKALASGQTAAVVRQHVLGVTAIETPFDIIARLQRPWGLTRFRRRRGAIVVRALPDDPPYDAAAIADVAGAAGFATLAFVVGERHRSEPFRHALPAAERNALALIALRCSGADRSANRHDSDRA